MLLGIFIILFIFKLFNRIDLFNLYIILCFSNLVLLGINNCFSVSIIIFYILILDTRYMLNFYNNDKILLAVLFALSVIKVNFADYSFILDILLFSIMIIILKRKNFKFNRLSID